MRHRLKLKSLLTLFARLVSIVPPLPGLGTARGTHC